MLTAVISKTVATLQGMLKNICGKEGREKRRAVSEKYVKFNLWFREREAWNNEGGRGHMPSHQDAPHPGRSMGGDSKVGINEGLN